MAGCAWCKRSLPPRIYTTRCRACSTNANCNDCTHFKRGFDQGVGGRSLSIACSHAAEDSSGDSLKCSCIRAQLSTSTRASSAIRVLRLSVSGRAVSSGAYICSIKDRTRSRIARTLALSSAEEPSREISARHSGSQCAEARALVATCDLILSMRSPPASRGAAIATTCWIA